MLICDLSEVSYRASSKLLHFRVSVQQILIFFLFSSYSPKRSCNFQILTVFISLLVIYHGNKLPYITVV